MSAIDEVGIIVQQAECDCCSRNAVQIVFVAAEDSGAAQCDTFVCDECRDGGLP